MKVGVKRISSLILIVVITASAFGACEQKDRNDPGRQAEPATEKADNSVTLNFTTWVNNKDANGNYVEENVVKEFTKQNPDIKVKFNLLSEGSALEYMQKIDMMLANGEELDVISFPSVSDYVDRVRKNMLLPLDEYIAADSKKYSEMFTVDTTVNERIYALPCDIKPLLIMLNKKYLDEAGLAIPKLDWTWEDYREYAKKLTKGDGKDKHYGSYLNPFAISPAISNYVLTESGDSNIRHPGIRKWLQFFYDLESIDNSHFPYFDAISEKVSYREVFFSGKIAMLPAGAWMIPEISGMIDKYQHEWVTAFATLPGFKDFPIDKTFVSIDLCSVPKTSKYPAEAYKLVKFNCEEGVNIRGTGLPAKKEYNLDQLLNTMMNGKDYLYDTTSLKAIMKNAKYDVSMDNIKYARKVTSAFSREVTKYLVGGETLDAAILNADKSARKIIEAN